MITVIADRDSPKIYFIFFNQGNDKNALTDEAILPLCDVICRKHSLRGVEFEVSCVLCTWKWQGLLVATDWNTQIVSILFKSQVLKNKLK